MNPFALLVMTLGLLPLSVAAQDLTPRAYWPAPKGTTVGTVGYAYSTGDTVPDPSLPVTGVNSDISTYYLGYLHTLDLWGRTSNLILELPFADGTTSAAPIEGDEMERSYRGMGDMAATLSVNFLGAPTMDSEAFTRLRQDPVTILAGSLKVIAPTGDYESDRVINIGATRWAAQAELGAIFPLHPRWLLELDIGRIHFWDNDDFLGYKREQKPINTIQAHLIRRMRAGFWMSLDLNYYEGGRSKIADRQIDDARRDSKAGFTVVYPFAGKNAIKAGYSRGSLNDSDENFDYYLIAYQRLF
jgi:hypothetical protein